MTKGKIKQMKKPIGKLGRGDCQQRMMGKFEGLIFVQTLSQFLRYASYMKISLGKWNGNARFLKTVPYT